MKDKLQFTPKLTIDQIDMCLAHMLRVPELSASELHLLEGSMSKNTELTVPEKQVYHGTILDLGFVDKTQLELFGAVGRTKGPFAGVIDWPYLNDLIEDQSRRLLSGQGEEAWEHAGGMYGSDGKPTFDRRSSTAAQIVQGIAATQGGFIWTDRNGTGWAVRLVSLRDQHAYAGLALSWNGEGRVIDRHVREEYLQAIEQKMGEPDGIDTKNMNKLVQMADRIWLFDRAEQILWAIHAAVLMQRSSVILVPDVTLGEVIWGAKGIGRPANWRKTLMDILTSLSQLHVAALRIGGSEWRPQFTMRSVAVAHCEIVELTQRTGPVCSPVCPLWNQPVAHDHFRIQIGYGFLGLLEHFAIRDDREGDRQFDFEQRKLPGDAGKVIGDARGQGNIVPVHLPTKVFGPSKWSGFSSGQLSIIQGLVREVTRVQHGKFSSRRDKAEVLVGNKVPDVRGRPVTCPLLLANERYVCFCGNGVRRGQGYLIVGNDGHGWLAKCGFVTANLNLREWSGKDGAGGAVRQLLADLTALVGIVGLKVVGIRRRNQQWLTLRRLTEIADLPDALDSLSDVHLRIYGPEDYLDRLRGLLTEGGQFSIIPGSDSEAASPAEASLLDNPNLDLKLRLRRAGLTQQALAAHLGVKPPFVSDVLNGKKPWPPGQLERAEEFVAGASSTSNEDDRSPASRRGTG
jgi:hypothetical protein